ncbi:hypothetical protein SO802_005742 [Lithocarpus litseifolius]|uniref:Uncharacterized protein n=1 Tax=Lithocarpus litseifolius TaxID=425828 RepID=A0AAW2DKC7_9ROSI
MYSLVKQGVTPKAIQWDLLEDPLGENGGTRDVKIGIVNKRKNGLALERGRTKPTRKYRVLQGNGKFDERDQKLERLCRPVRDLELEARGRHRRRDRDDREGRSDSGGNYYGSGADQSSARRRWERSHPRESCRRQNRSCSRGWKPYTKSPLRIEAYFSIRSLSSNRRKPYTKIPLRTEAYLLVRSLSPNKRKPYTKSSLGAEP